MTEKYQCEECGGIFTTEWSDEEAMAESVANFGPDINQDDLAIICDKCYNELMVN